jgi:hypothetical protein
VCIPALAGPAHAPRRCHGVPATSIRGMDLFGGARRAGDSAAAGQPEHVRAGRFGTDPQARRHP